MFVEMILALVMLALLLAVITKLTLARLQARRTQRPYWSVVRHGLPRYLAGLTLFAVVLTAVLFGLRVFVLTAP